MGFTVTWTCYITEVDTPQEAAAEAYKSMEKYDAKVFAVEDDKGNTTMVDLA